MVVDRSATALAAVDDAVVPDVEGRLRRQEGRQRGEGGGGDPADGAAPQDPAPLVEGVLRLGELLHGLPRRRLRQARERLGLAGVEAGQPAPVDKTEDQFRAPVSLRIIINCSRGTNSLL